MTVVTEEIKGALVFRDNVNTHRWYNAIGPGVTKYINNFETLDSDDSTGDATEFELTITEGGGGGDTTHVITDLAGGALLITTDNLENDGINMQLGAAAGESIGLSGDYPLYVGTELAINDVDQTDLFFGVGVTDTDWSGGITDGIYFSSIDESSALNFTTEKDSVENATAAATLADGVYIRMEFLYDGVNVKAYINDVEVTAAKTAGSAATFPDDELLRLTLEFLTGEAIANTCTVKWIRMIHLRGQ
jgi:hypothetical protein